MTHRSFAVIGLGRFGSAMAHTLIELGQDVIGVDSDEDRVRQLAEVLSQAAQIDATDLRALKEVGVQDVDLAVISIGENIEASLLVVMQVMELGVNEIIAKAVTPLHGRILQKLGVKRVIYPERDMAIRVAHNGTQIEALMLAPNAAELFKLMPHKPPPDLSRFLLSPMPGLLVDIAVKPGQTVRAGEKLAVIEAMKMENILVAAQDGTVAELLAGKGESLAVDQPILSFA